MIEGESPLQLNGQVADESDAPCTRVRLLSIPKFSETGELVLVDTETLEVEVVKFDVFKGAVDKL